MNGACYLAFPEPLQFAGVTAGEFSTLIHNERKAEYLHTVTRAFAEVDEDCLRHLAKRTGIRLSPLLYKPRKTIPVYS